MNTTNSLAILNSEIEPITPVRLARLERLNQEEYKLTEQLIRELQRKIERLEDTKARQYPSRYWKKKPCSVLVSDKEATRQIKKAVKIKINEIIEKLTQIS